MKKIITFYHPTLLKRKQLFLIDNIHCKKNKTSSNCFLKEELTNDLYEIKVRWITKKKEKYVGFKE